MTLAEIRTFAIIQAVNLVKSTSLLEDSEESGKISEVTKVAKKIEKFILTGK